MLGMFMVEEELDLIRYFRQEWLQDQFSRWSDEGHQRFTIYDEGEDEWEFVCSCWFNYLLLCECLHKRYVDEETKLWHLRLRHMGEKGMNQLSKQGFFEDKKLGNLIL